MKNNKLSQNNQSQATQTFNIQLDRLHDLLKFANISSLDSIIRSSKLLSPQKRSKSIIVKKSAQTFHQSSKLSSIGLSSYLKPYKRVSVPENFIQQFDPDLKKFQKIPPVRKSDMLYNLKFLDKIQQRRSNLQLKQQSQQIEHEIIRDETKKGIKSHRQNIQRIETSLQQTMAQKLEKKEKLINNYFQRIVTNISKC